MLIANNVRCGTLAACTLTLQAPAVCSISGMVGALTLAGMDGGTCSISMKSGTSVIILDTCTAGTINIYGDGTITDGSAGGCTVNDYTMSGDITTIDTVVGGIQTDLSNGTDGLGALKILIDAVPTVTEIQTEMEENGASLLDTLRDVVSHVTYGNSALQVLIAAIQTDLDNGTDGLGALKILIDAIKAKTDDQPAGVKKNVELANFEFLMLDSSNHVSAKTGLTITAEISKDGGAFAACSNSASEISDGVYKITIAQAEMNADIITLKFTAMGADQRTITIKTSS